MTARDVDVDVVLRNDDYSTIELVDRFLRGSFGLTAAAERVAVVHHTGAAVITRLPLADARRRILAARALARDKGMPLWIGVDDGRLAPYR